MITAILGAVLTMNFSVDGQEFSIKGSDSQLRLYFNSSIRSLLLLIKPINQTSLAYDGVMLDGSGVKQVYIRSGQNILRQDLQNRRDINLAPGILHWIGSTNISQGFKLQKNNVYQFMVILNASMTLQNFFLEKFIATGNYHTYKSNNREEFINRNLGVQLGNISNRAVKQNNYSTFVYKNIIKETTADLTKIIDYVYLVLLIKPPRAFKKVAFEVVFAFDNNFFVNQDLVVVRKNFTIVDLYAQSLNKFYPDSIMGGKENVQIVDYFSSTQVYYLVLKRPLQSSDIFFDQNIYPDITPICYGFEEFYDLQKSLDPSKIKFDCAIIKFASALGGLVLLYLLS